MKTFRICILVLLALLLPLRGAMAAAMLCPGSMPGGMSQMQHPAPHHAQPAANPHAMPAMVDHAYMQHHLSAAAPTGQVDSAGSPASCGLCCDFCSLTPLASSLPVLATAQEHATLSFPDFCAPAPSFISDGQERPPRSA